MMGLTHYFSFFRNHAWFHLHRLVRVARVLKYRFLSCLTPSDYTYKSLKQNYIRILEILPSNDCDSPVTCRLHVTSLGLPRLPYVAISYAWGDKNVERIAIVCDGRRALVTPNLHSVLVRLRGLNIHWVWVDALCIDQGSDEKALCERAEQVALMSQIFPFAQKVVVDLGELSESDGMFFEYVKLYEAIPQETWAAAAAWGTPDFLRNMTGLDSLKLPSRDSDFWAAFVQFMQRSWFNRLWVVQEYALAREVQIMLGHDLHGPEFFESTLYRIFTHAMHVAKFSGGSVDWEQHVQLNRMYRLIRKPCGALNTIRSMRRSNLAMSMGSPEWRAPFKEDLGFCELFDATRMFDCTDWQDRVYGVLGLACDAEAVVRSIPVDYKLGKEELSVRVSTYFISQGSSAYVLYNCRGQMASRESSWGLLSRREDNIANLMNVNGSCRGEVFNACGSTAASFTITRHGTAITKGSILGEIASMANRYPSVAIDVDLDWQLKKKLVDWLQGIEWWMECQGRQHSLPASEFRKQCQITLTADLIDLDYRPQRGSKVEGHAERVAEAWIQVFDDTATATSTSLFSEAAGNSENGEIAPSTQNKDAKAHPPQVSRYCQQELKRHIQDDVLQPLYKYLNYARGRRLAISTDDELVCCVPGESQVGDRICVLFGCHIPFVVRKDSDSDRFSMVGPCYIHHMMDGQALSSPSWNPLEIELI
jgi:hypothetical protein